MVVNCIFQNYVVTKYDCQDSDLKIGEICLIGKNEVLGKLISINSESLIIKPLERIEKIGLSDLIIFISISDITYFYPSIFGKVIDLVGNEYQKHDLWQNIVFPQNNKLDFIPVVQKGQKVLKGQKIGYAQIHQELKFWINSPTNSTILNIEAGTFEINQPVCTIKNGDGEKLLFFHTKVIQNHELKDNFIQTLQTDNPLIDIIFPIFLGSQNQITQYPTNLVEKLLDFKTIDLTILISNKIRNINNLNVIQILDNFDQPNICCCKAQLLANTISQSGYNVLILNELDKDFQWNVGVSTNTDAEQFSVTSIDLTASNKKFRAILSFDNGKLTFEDSFCDLENIDKYLLEVGNIQYISDFKQIHTLIRDDDSNDLYSLLLDEITQNESLTFDLIHNVLKKYNYQAK